MLAPFAFHPPTQCFIISLQQAVLVTLTHATLFPWRALSHGVHAEKAGGQIVTATKTPVMSLSRGKRRRRWHGVKYAQAIRRDYALLSRVNGSLIVNVISVSGKEGRVIKMVKTEDFLVYAALTVTV